ncbi:MAG: integral rane sensor hybrid histidine kinase [Chitinophagaceae bacterium]|nr:integral rane sensor hybrid histidine kinase [Chitinophagaceae bacterium]
MQDNFIDARKLSSLLKKFVILIPCMVLIGWQFNINVLKSILHQFVVMSPTTAVLFIICGISLYLIREENSDKKIKIGKYIGLLIAIIAIIRILGFYENLDIGIDQLLFSNKLAGKRMALNTAVNFVLIGFSLFFIDARKKTILFPSQLIAFLALIISLLAIIEHLYVATSSGHLFAYISMPMHTAITFIVVTMSILLSRYRYGFVAVIMHKNIGGVIIRKLLPVTIAVPITVSLLSVEGYKLKLYSAEFGASLEVIFIISIFSVILWWNAKSLNKSHDGRKRAELKLIKATDELAANEIKYRNLIENAGVVMFTASMEGIITFATSKSFQLTGYNTWELKGKRFADLYSEDCQEMIIEKYKTQVKDSIGETNLEFCINTKNGDIKWVEQSAILITENSLPVGFQCVIKDITERKKMESVVKKYEIELIQNQERLQSILDNATSLIYIKDLDGKYLLANKQFKKTLNVSYDEVIGKTDFDFGDHKQAQRYKETDEEVIRTCKPVELEETIEMPDGPHNILIIKFPLIDVQNKIYGISGIATDITERVRYQEQLIEAKKIAEDAKRLEEQFLANMSHEIRTPMNGIQGMTDLLLETKLNDEQKDFATTIKRSSDNLLVIINDILDFSKIQAGKLILEKIDFNLTEVLENVKALFKYRIQEKGLSLRLTVKEDVPRKLNGDPHRLNQVLINLIGNAIKFTQSGGINISISVQEKTAEEIVLSFTIADTGIGIAPEMINDIFESFTQASTDTTRNFGGTGLGLAITKQLLEMQNGKISVESKINIGTIFQFSIPYNYSKTINPLLFTRKDVKNYRSLFTGKKFLVAEDNEVNQKVIRHVLQKAGGAVDIANNGLEAISLLKKNKDYNLIIMDLQMPEMDGYAATKYIRNVMNLSIPIVAMTASVLKDEKSKCIEMGMNDYLSKPFDFSFIYQRISLLLDKKPVINYEPVIENPNNNLFDLSLLEEMDDNEYLSDVLDIFLANTPNELNELQRACASNHFNTIYKMAHKLKSSTGLLKATGLLDVLIKIEENAKAEKPEGLVKLAEEANKEYKKIETKLQEYLKNNQQHGLAVK